MPSSKNCYEPPDHFLLALVEFLSIEIRQQDPETLWWLGFETSAIFKENNVKGLNKKSNLDGQVTTQLYLGCGPPAGNEGLGWNPRT